MDQNAAPSRRRVADGRVLVIAALLLYYSVLLFGGAPIRTAWSRFGVPQAPCDAADLRHFPEAARCFSQGVDAYLSNPCDCMGRRYNYPRIWLGLAALGMTDANIHYWQAGGVLVFYLSLLALMGPLNWLEGAIVALLACSPALMLGVERGNVDAWIFSFLAAAILLFESGSAWTYGVILAAAVLKLYPAAALVMALGEADWKRALRRCLAVSACFLAYLWWIRDELRHIRPSDPEVGYLSFGRNALFLSLREVHKIDWSDRAVTLASLLALALAAIAAVALALLCRRRGVTPAVSRRIAGFRLGAVLYVFVFAVHTSFDYRLMLLLPILPQAFRWAASGDSWGYATRIVIGLMLFSFWMNRGRFAYNGIDELANMAIWVYCIVGFVLTMPKRAWWPSLRREESRAC